MRLWTPRDQRRARRFYEREGWTLTGGVHYESPFGLPVVEYARNLDAPGQARIRRTSSSSGLAVLNLSSEVAEERPSISLRDGFDGCGAEADDLDGVARRAQFDRVGLSP